MPAYEIVFTDDSAEATRKSIDKGFIDEANNRAYYLIFNADNSKYDQFLPTIQDAFDSFNLVGSSLLDEGTGGGAANDSFFGFQDDDSSLDNFFSSGQEPSGMEGTGGPQDLEQFMNSFADSIFNGSSTFGAVGTSMVNGIKVSGISIEAMTNYSAINFSSPDDEENTRLAVSLTSSASNSSSSVSVIAIRIPFNIQNLLSLASLSEGSTIGDIGGTNPLEDQELFQDFNPFILLSNLQIGSTSLVNPDWSTTQSLTMSLIGGKGGGGGVTNSSLAQTEEDTLDLVFVSVIPYTGG